MSKLFKTRKIFYKVNFQKIWIIVFIYKKFIKVAYRFIKNGFYRKLGWSKITEKNFN